jgi:hypothetical protein
MLTQSTLAATDHDLREMPFGLEAPIFAENQAVPLDRECLKAQIMDLGLVWVAGDRPSRDIVEPGNGA